MLALPLSLARATAVEPSPHVLAVAGMFGLGVDETRRQTIVPPVELRLRGSQIVFITGASGGGKSSLLRLIAQAAAAATPPARVIHFDALPEPQAHPLVDLFPDRSLDDVLRLLSLAGLADAFVMLRKPGELSDGQRYRLRLAQALAAVEAADETSAASPLTVMLADEFGATLDRVTAAVIARNLRKWVSRIAGVCFIAATTHDDLLEALEPDVLIEKGLGSAIEIVERGAQA
jgi:ABC-type ATPase with predicted acetyltransferase domain